MGRILSPVLRREFANLEKDENSRKSAMKVIKSCVKDLDSNSIPLFLAQVLETKNAGTSSGDYTISLYEVLARFHGPSIVSYIDNIMRSIIKTLTINGGPFPLQQACSKVVSAIARYGIEPTTLEDKKRQIIHSLCKPLSDSLLGNEESLSCGAALCLKDLVGCDNWRFASDEIVNVVCLRLAGALEDKPTQTNSHMGLVISLAKHNSTIIEPYARLLIQSGLRILHSEDAERNSRKQVTSIHMISFLMKFLDIRSIYSELALIIEEMEKCLSNQMPNVERAAHEALQTARSLVEKVHKCDTDAISVMGSNFERSEKKDRRCIPSGGDKSPKSQTLDSLCEYDSLIESPISTSPDPCDFDWNRKNMNRKLRSCDNGGVDISLKNGFFPENVHKSAVSHALSEHDEASDNRRGHSNEFAGFVVGCSDDGRSQSLCPQRTQSQTNVNGIKIFPTQRNLVRCLQENDANSNYAENQARTFRNPNPGKYRWSPAAVEHNPNGLSYQASHNDDGKGNITDEGEELHTDSNSVSPGDDIPKVAGGQASFEVVLPRRKNKPPEMPVAQKFGLKTATKILVAVFLGLLAVFVSIVWLGVGDEGCNPVPT
ncbi:hypothetical protein Nepgr_020597 [Nepenthes gracilis]|uniref:TORTIFOLIA1/SINE1-2 N-terminal domain-containing protein n=1 Tax=Nepenthes gracilis TaxID=150966 RepID=A0AAD3SZ24_NEPGR|nr:hypothetical protein Nepgr_020597 [Nepenthes gracilis]